MNEPRATHIAARDERLTADIERALADAEALWAASFGTGSRRALGERYARALSQPSSRGDFDGNHLASLRVRVEREHRAAHGEEKLAAEALDERERDAAVTSDIALIAYEKKWSKRLAKLQRAHPSRWRALGISDEELRDELTLRLIDAVRTKPEERSKHHRAGKEWGLLFMAQELRALRSGFRLKVVLTEPEPTLDRGMTEEERLIAEEAASLLGQARERAESGLSRPQRRWYAAMRMSANAGAFFESSGKLNLSAVARMLDKDRSSAQRAFGELSNCFVRELKKLGG